MRFTPSAIEKLEPRTERYEVAEDTGLRVIVFPSGKKTFAVRYRVMRDGVLKPAKSTIGPASMDLRKARDAVRIVQGELAKGLDPDRDKRAARESVSQELGMMFCKFLDEHTRTRKGLPIRDSTKLYTAGLLGLKRDGRGKWVPTEGGVLSQWAGKGLHTITEANVRELLKGMAPIQANRTLSALKVFYRWAKIRPAPTDDMAPPNPEVPRERVLSDDELRKVWLAAEDEFYPFGAMVRLLILTGTRKDEARLARWSEFRMKEREWHLVPDRTKNGRYHIVPLSDAVMELLESLPRIDDSDFVFTLGSDRPISKSTDRPLTRLCKRANVFDWTLHDFRRTFETGLQRLGFPIEVCEACTNHKSGSVSGIAAIYAKHDYAAEKRQAFDAWARHVTALVSGESADVIEFRRA